VSEGILADLQRFETEQNDELLVHAAEKYISKDNLNSENIIYSCLKTLHKYGIHKHTSRLLQLWSQQKGNTVPNITMTSKLIQLVLSTNQTDSINSLLRTCGYTSKLDESSTGCNKTVLSDMMPDDLIGYATAQDYIEVQRIINLYKIKKYKISDECATNLLKLLLTKASDRDVRACIRELLLSEITSLRYSPESVQLFSGKFVKNIEFLTGAVDFEKLPPSIYPEIAFVGRSNVGKLIMYSI
jgi:hypothetical protein